MSAPIREPDVDTVVMGAAPPVANEAESYGVSVTPAMPLEGEAYWRAIRVRHLSPDENRGKHNVYVDVLDEDGKPIRDPRLHIGWTWSGRRDDERADPKPLDKPENEPAGNVDLFAGQHVEVWVQGDDLQSDHVANLHTNHDDEPAPGGELWNTLGHHSFHVTFRRTRVVVTPDGGGETGEEREPDDRETDGSDGASNGGSGAPVVITHPEPTSTWPSYYPEFIFGIHESGGEHLMAAAGRKGWVLELAAIGLDGAGGGDFRPLASQGFGVIVRLNHGYGPTGTLPLPEQYQPFANACSAYVSRSQGCHVWIIGNEPNHEAERPNGQEITPSHYVQAYTLCRNAIRSLPGHEQDQVLVAGPAPWNALTRYPGNENGDWVKYFADTLALLPDGGCDGFAIHTYTQDLDTSQISGDFFQEAAEYQHRRNQFRTYIDFMEAIPPHFRRLPVFITETDPTRRHAGWGDGRNCGWVQAAYEEIVRWNDDPAHQPIHALILYRWPHLADQPEWSISNRQGIIDDFVQTLQKQPMERYRLRTRQAEQPARSEPDLTLPLAPIPTIFTNQQLIDAFYFAQVTLTGAPDYRQLLANAGLNVEELAEARDAPYGGASLEQLPNLGSTERAAIRRGLLAQLLKSVRWVGLVNAPAGLNLRTSAGTDSAVITLLAHDVMVQVLGEMGDWLFVMADGQAGYVSSRHVLRRIEPARPDGITVDATLAPPPDQVIALPSSADANMQAVVNTWNHYGSLLQEQAVLLGIDPAVAVAVLVAESGGRPFGADGRLIIRFENHIFYRYWGRNHQEEFDRHFTFNPDNQAGGHTWRADPAAGFEPCHTNQGGEWQIFEFASRLDRQAALFSISMGAPQIMGFNHAVVGYATVQEMFEAFCAGVRAHLAGLFQFVRANGLSEPLRRGDYVGFASGYNGPGNAANYAAIIQNYVRAFQAVGGGPRGLVPVVPAHLPVPLKPEQLGGKTLMEADPEFYAAWRRHIEQGFTNNQTMFSQVLAGFMNPYWTTVWMYRILFGIGVLSFVAAVGLSIMTGREGFALIFGGLSVVSMLAYFLNHPLQALEENLQFITWLGIIYNTYWTRLAYTSNLDTVHAELEDATEDAIAKVKELMDKHTERRSSRPGLR